MRSMKHRIVVTGIAIALVLGGVGGTVAALSGGGAERHSPHVSTPTTSWPLRQPATAAAGSPTTTSAVSAAPASSAPLATTTTLAPATGAPAGSRYGPTGSPSVAQTTTTTLAPAIGGPAGSRFGPTGTPGS